MQLRSDEVKVAHLIQVGEIIATLRTIASGARLGVADDGEPGVLDDLEELEDLLDLAQLADTVPEARRTLGPIVERLRKILALDPGAGLNEDDTQAIRTAATSLWTIAGAESLQRTAFVVPYDKEGFAERLKRSPAREFGVDDRWSWVPRDAFDDMSEVADSYAIGRYAASIVFSFRAVESCLRAFYKEIVRQKAGKTPWSQMHHVLQLPVLGPDDEVLTSLKVVQRERNAAMHSGPRDPKKWGARSAREVIEKCARGITAMGAYLDKRSMVAEAPLGD